MVSSDFDRSLTMPVYISQPKYAGNRMAGYISEIDYDGGAASNFVEIAVPASVDASNYTLVVYGKDGKIKETFSLGSPVNTIAGKHVYLINSSTPNWIDIKNDQALALVDDTGDVVQFISFKDQINAVEGPAAGTSSTRIGEHSGGNQSLVTSNQGATYSATPTSDPGVIACFAQGTLIDTPSGPCAVECLRPGDPVETLDSGPMPIVWMQTNTIWLDGPQTAGYPILISAGALGPGRPARDLVVSPQHRVLVGGRRQVVSGFGHECFAPAKSLTRLPGVREMRGKKSVTWVHFAFETHQVVHSNGCLTESLLLGPMVTSRMTPEQLRELDALFGPRGDDGWNGPAARPCLKVQDVRRIIDGRFRPRQRAA